MENPAANAMVHKPGHPRAAVVVLVASALLLGLWGAWRSFGPIPPNARERLEAQERRIDTLEQQATTLARSDQISRKANQDLQATLSDRVEEIASLRADVAFYERFVGAAGQRHGLSVHELRLKPQGSPGVWHFVATLTQNQIRDAMSSGRLELALEATSAGRMRTFDWNALRQQPRASGIDYAFKYFQQVEGDILLPAGAEPVRVIVRLQPKAGSVVEQSFGWSEAAGDGDAEGAQTHASQARGG
ncbi:DUF6776 family protein [Thermomonas sp.]|uniref:DUF6776 family protein n=1 Tax=Thermomonas sp. TaxID=1971895 RepID=UPI002624D3BB|nr:DUF6776 family protein [Thermomonas sp.]